MKIKGKVIGQPEPKTVVVPRTGEDFVFTITAVFNDEEFEKLCPKPEPTTSLKDGPIMDAAYRQRISDYSDLRTQWTIITAMSTTEGLEWDKVDMGDPKTWHLYEKELSGAGLSNGEIIYLIQAITDMNAVDEKKMEEARERFFATQAGADMPQ